MGRLGRLLMAGCLFLAATGSAQAQQTCSLVQITNSINLPNRAFSNSFPAINATGSRIAFASDADFVGQNGDGSFEVFLWDAATGLTQVTHTTDPLADTPVSAINAAGNRIAFSSRIDFLGSNGDHNAEIFLWDASTGLVQITNTISRDNRLPDLNEDGTRIALSSTADFVGSNSDGNYEIFLWHATTGFTQITHTMGGNSSGPQLNAAGNRIVFSSSADLLGTNIDRNSEIFLWEASAGFTQITDTDSLASSQSTLNAAGDRIAFLSRNDLTGSNADHGDEVFLWNAATGLAQATAFPPASTMQSPSINAAGNRVAFADIESPGLYLWVDANGVFRVLNGFSFSPSINAAGNRIAFSSNANPVGSNGDGNHEIFLATCPGGAPPVEAAIPAVSPLGLAALAVLLGLAAAWTLRRRRA